MTNVFISYRRSDTSAHAGHIAAGLRAHASRPEVFLDTSGIEPGAPWPDALTQALSACNVMLVVIGPRWAEPLPGQARGRLFDKGDVVAEELRQALGRRQVTVVPVLVGGASRPTAADLPDDLAPLLLRQGRPLRDDTFDDDLAALARRVLVPRWWDRPLVRTAGGVAAAAMLGAGALWLWPHPPAGPGRPIDLDVEVRYTPKPTAGGLAPVLQLMEDRPMARDAVPLRRVEREGAAAPVYFRRGWQVPAPGVSLFGQLTRGDVMDGTQLSAETAGQVQTPVCFDVVPQPRPPASGPLVLRCIEGRGCDAVTPEVLRPCRPLEASLPAAGAWLGVAHAAPVLSDRPQADDWVVPTLASLERRRGTDQAVGFSRVTIAGAAPPEAAGADAVALDVTVNGHRLWSDGLPGRAFPQAFDPAQPLALSLGLENLDAAGRLAGLEAVVVSVQYLKGWRGGSAAAPAGGNSAAARSGQAPRGLEALHTEVLTLEGFSALRPMSGSVQRPGGPALTWTASYHPAPADRFQMFAYGGASQARNEAVRQSIDDAGSAGVVGPAVLAGGRVRGILRSPVASDASWGVAVGVEQPNGQLRISFDDAGARALCRQLIEHRAALRGKGLDPLSFEVRVIAEAVGDKRGKQRVACAVLAQG